MAMTDLNHLIERVFANPALRECWPNGAMWRAMHDGDGWSRDLAAGMNVSRPYYETLTND